jgi:integrase/recombinase XerC
METIDAGLLPDFKTWLLLAGEKETTADQKIKDLRRFIYLGISLQDRSFFDYIESLLLKHMSSSYINHQISSMRVFTRFLKERNVKFNENLLTFKFLPVRTKEKVIMSIEEIKSLIELRNPSNSPAWDKWTVFFIMLAFTGARPSEIAHLKLPDDIDFGRNVFIFRNTKTNNNRLCPISMPDRYLKVCNDYINSIKDGFLFPANTKDGCVSCSYWTHEFRRRIGMLGIGRQGLTCYSLRHSYITEMLQTEGVNVFDVQNIVGHRKLETTQKYYHLCTRRLQEVSKMYSGLVNESPENIIGQLNLILDRMGILRDKRLNVSKKVTDKSLEFKVTVR